MVDTPRGNASYPDYFTGTQLTQHMAMCQWVRQQAQERGLFVVDTWPYLADPASTQGGNLAQYYTGEALHPNQLGAYGYWTGKGGIKGLNAILPKLFPGRNILPSSNSDRFDAANRPGGCINPNPMLVETNGIISGALTNSACIASNIQVAALNTTGATITITKHTDDDGVVWQRLTIAGTPTAASAQVRINALHATGNTPTIPTANLAIGDDLDAGVQFRVKKGQTGINSIFLALALQTGGTLQAVDGAAPLQRRFTPQMKSLASCASLSSISSARMH